MAKRILIADRSDGVRRSLRAPLEQEGFAVSEARDRDEALMRLRGRSHDLAFVDTELAGGALELLDAVKTDPELARVGLVLLGEDLAEGTVLEGIERGASDCLRKPVEPIEAVLRARAVLRTVELQGRVREGNRHLAELAATDDLTGLLSRRFLSSHLRGLVGSAERHERPLALALFDVDRFKAINDEHGHPAGDVVLQAIVERMQSRLRKEDLLGRWGGEEFLLLLPDIGLEGALTAAEGLREAVEEMEIAIDERPVPVTISAGVTAWRPGQDPRELIDRADAALYEAKRAGRNQVRGEGVERSA